ncbi:DEKNAAC101386 [Brettanomyces naardenensis]|uniref:DEKNAAC101386 n=1 Tax=Brettanomyces naardenensis TaxID=13370 RepID=A0A448YHW3_BRENA|nr:DEKNAAC101386 [Brettanomyces naardenensis]
MDDYEEQIYDILDRQLLPKSLEVRDISGGCGSMFSISIESDKFRGLSTIKQHRLVNTILKDEISKWHGLQLKTKKTE